MPEPETNSTMHPFPQFLNKIANQRLRDAYFTVRQHHAVGGKGRAAHVGYQHALPTVQKEKRDVFDPLFWFCASRRF